MTRLLEARIETIRYVCLYPDCRARWNDFSVYSNGVTSVLEGLFKVHFKQIMLKGLFSGIPIHRTGLRYNYSAFEVGHTYSERQGGTSESFSAHRSWSENFLDHGEYHGATYQFDHWHSFSALGAICVHAEREWWSDVCCRNMHSALVLNRNVTWISSRFEPSALDSSNVNISFVQLSVFISLIKRING